MELRWHPPPKPRLLEANKIQGPLIDNLSTRARIHSHLGRAPQSIPVAIPAPDAANESTRHRNTAATEKDDALEYDQEHKPSRVAISGSRCGVLNKITKLT